MKESAPLGSENEITADLFSGWTLMSVTWPHPADMLLSFAWVTLTGRFCIKTFNIGNTGTSTTCCFTGGAGLCSLMVMDVNAGLGLCII